MPLSLPSLPFSVLVTLSSYLPISSTLSLSRTSKSLHRIMTSRDFDNTFWHYCHDSTLPSRPSLAEYISANEQSSSKHSEANEDSFQLSVQISRAHEDTEVGALYYGRVVRLMTFGAFVELAPGKDGLVHISKLADHRIEKVEDACKIGDMMWVKVTEIDEKGRVNLSHKDAMKEIKAKEAAGEPIK